MKKMEFCWLKEKESNNIKNAQRTSDGLYPSVFFTQLLPWYNMVKPRIQ